MRLSTKKIWMLAITGFVSMSLSAQTIQDLRKELQQLLSTKNATAGISIKGIGDKDTLSINGNMNMPMMSVFKFHIALAVLNQVDKGKLKLNQKFFIKKQDLHPNTWSPMREEFPDGDIHLTLDQVLRYTVSHSDNNGCDILLDIIGGPATVQQFINKQGIKDFVIKLNEQEMAVWENLYINTSTPLATTQLLEKFYKGKVLSKTSTKYLYQVMVETSRGLTWMKAGLPEGTELAHRTGISGTNDHNLRAALNDVGIVKLPDGKHFILSVYLKNITEEREVTEKLVADIAKATWNYFTRKQSVGQSFQPRVVYKSENLVVTQLGQNAFEHQSFLQTKDFGKVPCNGMIVKNSKEAVVFDTTPDSASSAELISWIQKNLHCTIKAVVTTHFHIDNLGGLKAFEQHRIPSYANYKTIEYAKERKENMPQNGFDKQLDLKVGNKTVEVRFFGEGHTKDNVVGYFGDDNILFGGCLIKEINATKGNLADANESEWSETVKKIKKVYPGVKTVIPGHGKYGQMDLLDYTIKLFNRS